MKIANVRAIARDLLHLLLAHPFYAIGCIGWFGVGAFGVVALLLEAVRGRCESLPLIFLALYSMAATLLVAWVAVGDLRDDRAYEAQREEWRREGEEAARRSLEKWIQAGPSVLVGEWRGLGRQKRRQRTC